MNHTMTYELCVKLINAGKGAIVDKNIDLYLAAGRITPEEYEELIEMLHPSEIVGDGE